MQIPVTKVAISNGFSTPSALNKAFKEEFGLTPSEYRSRYAANPDVPTGSDERKEKVLRILQQDQELALSGTKTRSVIRADTERFQLWGKWKNRVLNVGPVHLLETASMQKQVLFLAQTLNVEYLRVWNPFAKQLMICGTEAGEYNFSFLDEILDFCVDNHLKLFIDLAQRKNVAMASEKKEIYSSDDQTEFDSRDKWADALSSLLAHLRKRYPEDVTASWIFELTFFLNDKPYYFAESNDRREVWKTGCEVIRTYIPSARIAGPGMIDNEDHKQMEQVITDFLQEGYAPDIFTAIHYPYSADGDMETGAIYQKPYEKIANRDFLDKRMDFIRSVLFDNNFTGEYWVTEWGNSLANRNFVQDSCFRGAFILENFLRNQEKAHAIGIFYASDLLNVFSDSDRVLSGSAGLLSRGGIRKPAYYAYRFLSLMGRFLILRTENCIVTAENESDIRILCYNNKALGMRYYLTEENTHRPEDVNRLFINLEPQNMELHLRFPGPERLYRVRHQILNEEKGDVLTKWIAFGCTSDLSRGDLEYLKQTCVPEITSEQVMLSQGELQLHFRMAPNEMRMITITKER